VPGYFTYIVVRTAMDPKEMAAAIRREVRQVDPMQPVADIQPMAQYVSSALARPRLYAARSLRRRSCSPQLVCTD
jgi:hypothetical protein